MCSWLVRLLSHKAPERRTAQRPTFASMCRERMRSGGLPSVSRGWRRCLGASCAGLPGGRGRCLLIRARCTTFHWAPTLAPPPRAPFECRHVPTVYENEGTSETVRARPEHRSEPLSGAERAQGTWQAERSASTRRIPKSVPVAATPAIQHREDRGPDSAARGTQVRNLSYLVRRMIEHTGRQALLRPRPFARTVLCRSLSVYQSRLNQTLRNPKPLGCRSDVVRCRRIGPDVVEQVPERAQETLCKRSLEFLASRLG